jgi:hypothetical protein
VVVSVAKPAQIVPDTAAIPHISVITIQPANVESVQTDGTNILIPNGTASVDNNDIAVSNGKTNTVKHKG